MSRDVPGEIFAHGPKHSGSPFLRLPVLGQRRLDRSQQSGGCIILKLKACVLINRIIKTAGRADYRDRAVAEAVYLIESTGFITAGHEEHVGGSFYAVGQRIVIADAYPDLRWIRNSQILKELFVFGLAGAERNERDLQFRQSFAYFCDQIG